MHDDCMCCCVSLYSSEPNTHSIVAFLIVLKIIGPKFSCEKRNCLMIASLKINVCKSLFFYIVFSVTTLFVWKLMAFPRNVTTINVAYMGY